MQRQPESMRKVTFDATAIKLSFLYLQSFLNSIAMPKT